MSRVSFTPSTQFFDPKTGYLTRDGFQLIQFFVEAVNGSGAVLTVDGIQTLTNKTIDGDNNTFRDIATANLKLKTGNGSYVVTATVAGTSGTLASWDADGNVTSLALTGIIEDAINDGVTSKAPSENAVFDALALKADKAAFAVNGTVATVLGSVGPAGSNVAVQKWLQIDDSGTPRYIPCF